MSKGNVNKANSDYRGALLKAVESDADHPINNGIHMEAHHLISSEAIKRSSMETFLIDNDYEINDLSNLAFLPATLPGACHLEIQLHRGNHISTTKEQINDDDDKHPRTYHLAVAKLLREVKKQTYKDCTDSRKDINKAFKKQMSKLSKKILVQVNRFELPLSPIMNAFKPGASVGCGNCVNIKEHQLDANQCHSKRNHHDQQHPKFKSGKFPQIITRTKKTYQTKAGQ